MTTVPVNALPPPHFFGVVDGDDVERTRSGTLLFARVVDDQVQPRKFRASWHQPRAITCDVVRRHFEQHQNAVLSLRLLTGEVVRAQWSGPPTIQHATAAAAASMTAEFDECLAFES